MHIHIKYIIERVHVHRHKHKKYIIEDVLGHKQYIGPVHVNTEYII